MLVTVLAVIWAAFEFLNISWPRTVYGSYLDWSVWIAVVALGLVGAVVFFSIRRNIVQSSIIDAEELADETADDAAGGHSW